MDKLRLLFTLTIEEYESRYRKIVSEETERILKGLLLFQKPTCEESDLCRIKEASEITGYTVNTIYRLVFNKVIPYIKPDGSNFLWFSRKALEKWQLERNSKTSNLTLDEFETASNKYLVTKANKKRK